jgi:hypothetical protein
MSARFNSTLRRSAARLLRVGLAILSIYIVEASGKWVPASASQSKEKADNLSSHSFPALGSSFPRRVEVSWNQFYDTALFSRQVL